MNSTYVIDPELCTLSTCPLSLANQDYVPTLAGNTLYATIFGILLLVQLVFGIRYKTWGYLVGMVGGLLLEVLGYVGRIQMHSNPFTQEPFLLYLICLTIGPAFLSSAIYLCLSRIVVVYGQELSRFRPRTYTITFILCDFIALVLQGAGGGLASTADTQSATQGGINVMIAGLAFQVASSTLFILLCAEFAWRVRRAPNSWEPRFDSLRRTFRFQAFLWSLGLATIFILVRSSYRVAELSQGFDGTLANQEVSFMILEGAMIVIACLLLTALHPGVAFAGEWQSANFTLRQKKQFPHKGEDQEYGSMDSVTKGVGMETLRA